MSSKISMLKSTTLVAALAAGISGIAHADMGRFDASYRYFFSAPVDNAPSAWRQANPNGLSELELEQLSSDALARHVERSTFDKTPSTWRQTHPNALSERELQALSSDAPAWHQLDQSGNSALASTNDADASREPLGARIARFFHLAPASQTKPAN